MLNSDLFGYAATGLNIVMLLPQVLQTWKTKQTKDLSQTTLVIFLIACILWIIYGVAKAAVPIVIANTVVGASNLFLLTLKFRYR